MKEKKKRIKIKRSTLALAYLIQNPTWSDKQVANAVGCTVEDLAKFPMYRKAREAQFSRLPKSKGWFNVKTGQIEAVEVDE